MTALELLEKYRIRLVGRRVLTEPYGEYPGGEARVTKIEPDEAAPEIVFNVRHPTFGEIGVFAYEEVEEVIGG